MSYLACVERFKHAYIGTDLQRERNYSGINLRAASMHRQSCRRVENTEPTVAMLAEAGGLYSCTHVTHGHSRMGINLRRSGCAWDMAYITADCSSSSTSSSSIRNRSRSSSSSSWSSSSSSSSSSGSSSSSSSSSSRSSISSSSSSSCLLYTSDAADE